MRHTLFSFAQVRESSIDQQGSSSPRSMERILATRKLHPHPPPLLSYFFHIILYAWLCYCAVVNAFISTTLQVNHHHHHHQRTRTRCIRSRVFSSPNDQHETSSSIRLSSVLHRMTVYFDSMVDSATQRFFLVCRPVTNERIHSHCPLRELGCAWDATTALQIFRNNETCCDEQLQDSSYRRFHQLENAVQKTIEFYSASFEDICSASRSSSSSIGKSLHRDILQEPPNIAHSALLILTLIGATRLSLVSADSSNNMVDALTQGILSMQRPDGAFQTHFGSDNIDKGIAFYPGEAMTAIMEAYLASGEESGVQEGSSILMPATRDQILPAMLRALEFYQHLYKQGQLDTNFNVWQVSAFARLVCVLTQYEDDDDDDDDDDVKMEQNALATRSAASCYVLDLCRDIVATPSWKMLARGRSFYPNLATVEIACGLDAIVQGSRLVRAFSLVEEEESSVQNAEDLVLFRNAIDNAIEFIHWSLDRVPEDALVGYGGLGFGGIQVMEQRLDVTGHALAALAKTVHPR
jgi:hypothetical protein